MNFTRIIGQNNKIYCKLGDYCVAETNGEYFIICSICQKEYQCEQSFQRHLNETHKELQSIIPIAVQQNSLTNVINNEIDSNKVKCIPTSPSTIYMDAEYLENIELNEANVQFVCDDVIENAFEVCAEQPIAAAATTPTISNALVPLKQYDMDKISSKHLLNGKVLKKLFKQIQCTNHEFQQRVNSLMQQVENLERQFKIANTYKRSNCMKIIPAQPFRTRDEVLTLDEDLHHSKEMRECLHDEALLVTAENAEVYTRVLWRIIMNDEVAKQFCWRGVIEADKVIKYPIKDLTLIDIFQGVFREKFPAQPINYFKERTMVYFNKAAERLRRQLQMKHKKATTNAAAEDSDIEASYKQQHSDLSNFSAANNDYNEYYTDSYEMFTETFS